VAAVIGTLGTIVSVYKLLHNIFLGQLRVEHEAVREVPWSMLVPMLALSAVVFVTGFAPGLVLEWVATVQRELGLAALTPTLGGVDRPDGGLDMLWVVGIMLAGFGVGALVFLAGGRARTVHQLDNYAGGHFLSADVRYHYSDNFYAGLMHRIGPWYRGSFRWLQDSVVALTDFLAQGAAGVYRVVQPTAWLLGVAVLALWWAF
jgi:NADH-quinone oxidoreductase subunit M